jgi:hypothetical protein
LCAENQFDKLICMRNAFPPFKSVASWRLRLVLVIGFAVIFALLGPFGTFEAMSLAARFLYWFVLLAAAEACLRVTKVLTLRFFSGLSQVSGLIAKTIVFVAIFSPVAWGLSGFFEEELLNLMGFLTFAVNVAGVAGTLAVLTFLLSAVEEVPQTSRARLYDRLPVQTDAAILRLTVNDHYVEVFLHDGTCHRVLMRLTDAIGEMDDTPGYYTHRSHWVAAAHVKSSLREGSREFVILTDGAKVPVSKTYRENVREADLL